MQVKALPTHRLGAKVLALAVIFVGISVTTPLSAQNTTVIGGHGGSSVEVDFSALDSLPPVSTLPELLRPGLLPYARPQNGRLPFRGERSRIGSRDIGSTRPAPRPIIRPTRPRIAAPNVAKPSAPVTKAAARPTRPTLATRTPAVAPKPPIIATARPQPLARKPQPATRSAAAAATTALATTQAPTTTKAKAPPKAPSIVSTPPVPAPPKPIRTASRAPAPSAPPQPSAATSAAPNSGAIQLLFDQGQSDFTDQMEGPLAPLVKDLKSNEKSRVQLLAYAASVDGNASKARRLSLSRALSVRAHLMAQGIASTRMDVRALGDRDKSGPADRVDVLLLVPR